MDDNTHNQSHGRYQTGGAAGSGAFIRVMPPDALAGYGSSAICAYGAGLGACTPAVAHDFGLGCLGVWYVCVCKTRCFGGQVMDVCKGVLLRSQNAATPQTKQKQNKHAAPMPSSSDTADWNMIRQKKNTANMTKQMYANAIVPTNSPVLYLDHASGT
jgi:hypothetical protein